MHTCMAAAARALTVAGGAALLHGGGARRARHAGRVARHRHRHVVAWAVRARRALFRRRHWAGAGHCAAARHDLAAFNGRLVGAVSRRVHARVAAGRALLAWLHRILGRVEAVRALVGALAAVAKARRICAVCVARGARLGHQVLGARLARRVGEPKCVVGNAVLVCGAGRHRTQRQVDRVHRGAPAGLDVCTRGRQQQPRKSAAVNPGRCSTPNAVRQRQEERTHSMRPAWRVHAHRPGRSHWLAAPTRPSRAACSGCHRRTPCRQSCRQRRWQVLVLPSRCGNSPSRSRCRGTWSATTSRSTQSSQAAPLHDRQTGRNSR